MWLLVLITRLIETDIAPLIVLFCNCPLFCKCPLLKDISFITVFVGLVWLTSNHMVVSGNFWDKSPSLFLKIVFIVLEQFQKCQKCIRLIIPNRPPKHVITTGKPLYSGHLRFLKQECAISRCPLYRVLDFLMNKSS